MDQVKVRNCPYYETKEHCQVEFPFGVVNFHKFEKLKFIQQKQVPLNLNRDFLFVATRCITELDTPKRIHLFARSRMVTRETKVWLI